MGKICYALSIYIKISCDKMALRRSMRLNKLKFVIVEII